MKRTIAQKEVERLWMESGGAQSYKIGKVREAIDRALAAERRRVRRALREESVVIDVVAWEGRTVGLSLDMALACIRPERGR